uniref:Uncharacterized protein n=1 Tax=Coccidioides posadasii RMSCC 3488 TaxID=454284 RepID=A0A0J6FB19_COCPO|nr:hypothetical protein CPAG_03787 [Coccidioides posadasii RMSCC 3488]
MPETGGGLDFPERPQNNLTSRIKMSSHYWITGSKCGIYVLRYIVKAKAQIYNAIKSIMTELKLVGLSNFERMSQTFLSIPSVENECRKSLTIYMYGPRMKLCEICLLLIPQQPLDWFAGFGHSIQSALGICTNLGD